MSTTPSEPAHLDAICALCGKLHSTHRYASDHCSGVDDTWLETRFTPAQSDAREVGTKHTPLPWEVKPCTEGLAAIRISANGLIIVDCLFRKTTQHAVSEAEARANSAHIIHCVNTLPGMEAKLEAVKRECDKHKGSKGARMAATILSIINRTES